MTFNLRGKESGQFLFFEGFDLLMVIFWEYLKGLKTFKMILTL
jgi:hypothetical protein